MKGEIEPIHTVICTRYSAESEEEFLDLAKSARDVDSPEGLHNEDIYMSEDELDDFNVMYSSGGLTTPSNPTEYSAILANNLGDLRFHVHSYIEQDHFEDLISTHQQMVARAGEIEVSFLGVGYQIDREIEEVLRQFTFLDVDEDSPDIDAINFVDGGLDVTIQNYPVETLIGIVEPEIDPIEASTLSTRVEEAIENSKDKVWRLFE